jgi:hypothetical protein
MKKVRIMSSLPARRVAAAILALSLSSVAVAACTKNQSPPDANQTTPPAGSTEGTGNGVPPTTSPPTVAPPTYPSSADAYAKAGVNAWVNHDSTRLDQLEVAGGQIHTLASCNGCYNLAFTFIHCEGAAGSSYCLFFNAVGDELNVHLQNVLLGTPHAIVAGSIWSPITFPSDDKAYAQEALNAWLSHNDARLKLLTQASMTSAQVDALGANHNVSWTFDHSEGAAGSTYYSWHDPSGHLLAFRFLNGTPAPSTGAASHHRITEIVYLP